MLYILSLILIIIGLIKKNSKIVFYLVFILLLLLLLGGNTENADRLAYMNNYYAIANGITHLNFEFGFQILCKVCLLFRMTYTQFLFTISLIGITLISSTIKRFTSNITYVLVLYFIYPFIWDTVQIRNFLAMSIIIFGSRYIISYKKEYIKYIICVLVASSIHITAIFYLAVLLILAKSTKRVAIIVTLLTVFSILLMPTIVNVLGSFTTVQKIEVYTLTQTSLFTKVIAVIYFAVSVILVFISKNIMSKRNKEDNIQEESKVKQIDGQAVLQINIICVMTLYFVMNNLNFFRLYRNIFVINYILFSVVLSKMEKNIIYYIFYLCVLIFTILSCLFLIIYLPTTNIFNPVFDNNIIL